MLFTLQAIASSSMGEEEMLSEGKLQETNVVAVEVERWGRGIRRPWPLCVVHAPNTWKHPPNTWNETLLAVVERPCLMSRVSILTSSYTMSSALPIWKTKYAHNAVVSILLSCSPNTWAQLTKGCTTSCWGEWNTSVCYIFSHLSKCYKKSFDGHQTLLHP